MFVGFRNVLLLSVCLLFAMGQAWAVALGKIEVTSHLGETFFAEAPIQLDAGEKISDVSVELAAPSDYQILEVFRDAALSKLSVEVVNDLRGPRAVIKSTEAVDTPYFNLVLKLRYGHATNFKKYPVFLDLPEQIRPPVAAPVPVATAPAAIQTQPDQGEAGTPPVDIRPMQEAAPGTEVAAPAESAPQEQAVKPTGSQFHPYEGWARTSRYGPMVRGDTITTVARRLPVDERYSLSQIMVGLYNKNKDKFRENNINLINAGTYLDVPTAADVESVSDREAKSILKQQAQRWKELKNQPIYAAEAEAQANRYRTRVRVGQAASGTAAAPVQAGQTQPETGMHNAAMQEKMSKQAGPGDAAAQAASDQLRALQEENLRLKQALQASEDKAAGSRPETADAAAADEQVKKLELTVARLQRQLKQVNGELQEVRSQDMNSLTYALAGIIVLLIAVAGYLLFLLRRDRPHPTMPVSSSQQEPNPQAESLIASAPGLGADVAPVDEAVDEGTAEEAMDQESFAESLDADLHADRGTGEQAGDALLFEDKAPMAQAGVDYLAEAEVYLRYGMDDEALQQMRLAIQQKPDHLEAHTRLVHFLQARGDQEALAAAIEAARSALSGNDLQSFEDSLQASPGEDAGEVVDAADSGDVTADGEKNVQAGSDPGAAVQAADMDLDLSDMFAPEQRDAAGEMETVGDGLDFDMGEPGGVDEVASATDAGVVEPEADLAGKVGAESGDAQDFVSSIEISPLADDEAATAAPVNDAQGLDFTPETGESLDTDIGESPEAFSVEGADVAGLDFESPEVSKQSNADFSYAESDVSSLDLDADQEDVPETVIEPESGDEELGLDDILGEFANDESPDSTGEGSIGVAEEKGEPVEETVIDTASADDDLGLDDILGEFESYAGEDAAQVETARGDGEQDVAVPSGVAEMPEMDVSDELDELLAEWGEEGGELDIDAGPENLDMDRARSLLAEGSLDEAETVLQGFLDGDRRGDALIGMAELAARRGDEARRDELLAEAEALVDDRNREWFDSVRGQSL